MKTQISHFSNNNYESGHERCKRLNNKFITELIKLSSIENIEAGIIKYFCYKNGLSNIKNRFIAEISRRDPSDTIFKHLKQSEIEMDLYDIEKIFELLIPEKDKQINGAVYTPSFIVDYIVQNTINSVGVVCDPACGSGAFLLGALKKLKELSGKRIIETIENNIFGIDILDYAIRRAKIILTLYALLNGEDKELIRFNLHQADSLEINWDKIFSSIFIENSGFDYVIGNPPYVRIQDLNPDLKHKLSQKWESINNGNFNLYFAFFELGLNILNERGKLGFITPNNYFTSLAGIELRQYFSEKKKINRILNFNHLKLFENASTYTCITFMGKSYSEDYFEYCYIDNKNELSDLQNLKFGKCFYNWLNDSKWRLMIEKDFINVKKIENAGRSLGELFPVRVGIATLKDPIYFVYDYDDRYCITDYEDKKVLIEKEITRKIIKISAIKSEADIRNDKRRIIFPYKKVNGKYLIISELELRENFPRCYAYLESVKNKLTKRDKGKKSYPTWYAWGRTQGMGFKGFRLYTRTFYHKPDFMLDESEDNLFCNGYAIFGDNHIKALQKLLNSMIMQYYIKKTSVEIEGNYQCYQKNFIERFSIPTFTNEEWEFIENENDMKKINTWLIKKYDLKL